MKPSALRAPPKRRSSDISGNRAISADRPRGRALGPARERAAWPASPRPWRVRSCAIRCAGSRYRVRCGSSRRRPSLDTSGRVSSRRRRRWRRWCARSLNRPPAGVRSGPSLRRRRAADCARRPRACPLVCGTADRYRDSASAGRLPWRPDDPPSRPRSCIRCPGRGRFHTARRPRRGRCRLSPNPRPGRRSSGSRGR